VRARELKLGSSFVMAILYSSRPVRARELKLEIINGIREGIGRAPCGRVS